MVATSDLALVKFTRLKDSEKETQQQALFRDKLLVQDQP